MAKIEQLVTRTTQRGQLVVGIREYIPGHHIALATLDGKPAASGSVLPLDPATMAKLPAGFTHYLAHSTAPVALRADEAATLTAAIDAANREYVASESGQADALRTQREQIEGDIQAAIEDQTDAYETAHAREDVLAEQIKASHEPTIQAARSALAAFDAAHPEIVQTIRDEKRETAERFLRND